MSPPTHSTRLDSLDAFRGFTIAAMILVNQPGSWSHVYAPLLHAEWHGWTPTDLIFPFFLFIVGVAVSFSFSKRLEDHDRRRLIPKILRRSALLFALGMLPRLIDQAMNLDLANLRYPGVLQRIALVYLATALIVLYLSPRARAWTTVALLVGYWAAMALVPVPGHGAGVLTPEGNLAAYIDRLLVPGKLYHGTWDPEGLFSTLPAIASALLGVFTGDWLRTDRDRNELAAGMFTAGWIAILVGLAWHLAFPINKNLWTSSYVVFTTGAALQALAACYWLIDVRGHRRWAWPAIVFGLNAITVFVLSGLLTKTLVRLDVLAGPERLSAWGWVYEALSLPWLTPKAASLVMALGYLGFWWLVMWWMYRRRIFLKV